MVVVCLLYSSGCFLASSNNLESFWRRRIRRRLDIFFCFISTAGLLNEMEEAITLTIIIITFILLNTKLLTNILSYSLYVHYVDKILHFSWNLLYSHAIIHSLSLSALLALLCTIDFAFRIPRNLDFQILEIKFFLLPSLSSLVSPCRSRDSCVSSRRQSLKFIRQTCVCVIQNRIYALSSS